VTWSKAISKAVATVDQRATAPRPKAIADRSSIEVGF